jgi:hypothetical protein
MQLLMSWYSVGEDESWDNGPISLPESPQYTPQTSYNHNNNHNNNSVHARSVGPPPPRQVQQQPPSSQQQQQILQLQQQLQRMEAMQEENSRLRDTVREVSFVMIIIAFVNVIGMFFVY